jgi:glycosyltransferase involved in cell wall biosynthesis
VERGVPARLDIIGGGPEEAVLREQSRELVARGVVRFPGILSNEQVLDVFEQSDVLLLTSEYEGLPMTVLEAMGRGCIPVLTDIESGIPELVRDGNNGFSVPVGDTVAFAERLTLLQRQPDLRERLSAAAYDTVSGQGYRMEAMTERYVKLFEQVMESAQSGSFTRPRGEILPPPELMAASRSVWKRWVVGGVRSAGRRIKELLHA